MSEQTHAEFTRIVAESLETEGLVWRSQYIPHADWSWKKRALAAEAAVQGVLNLDLRCDDYYDCYVPGKPLKNGACLPCSVRAAIANAIRDEADREGTAYSHAVRVSLRNRADAIEKGADL